MRSIGKLLVFASLLAITAPAQTRPVQPVPAQAEWSFAVSGDSRNCGDVVMPGIAARVVQSGARFYWHLGDFRAIYDFDQDYRQHHEHQTQSSMSITDYQKGAWQDFIESELAPFGPLPVFLAAGNHEMYSPKGRNEYLIQFADWLEQSPIQQQRLRDDRNDHRLKAYYHWMSSTVDFVTLDNATHDQFDPEQVHWFEGVLARAQSDPAIRAMVIGMHAALPDSIASGHSMNDWPAGEQSGRRVYEDLLKFQAATGKRVYILASHSHFYMAGIFNTEYWRSHGGVLPGWIIGTAGAVRYPLPSGAKDAETALTNVYGYLLATVHADHSISFRFEQVRETDVPPAVIKQYSASVVHDCYAENTEAK
jgi:hypothetical protein